VLYLDAQTAGFANFSALDIFVNRSFFLQNRATCKAFIHCIKEAIYLIQNNPQRAMDEYYAHTSITPSSLMDDILQATIECFDPQFYSNFSAQIPILEFFQDIKITDLDAQTFKTAFLDEAL